MDETTKTCIACGGQDFYPRYDRSQSGSCKSCAKRRTVEWRKLNPEHNAKLRSDSTLRVMLRSVGKTREWFDEQMRIQNERCAICHRTSEEAGLLRLHVDHDHELNEARALLCKLCNLLLGVAREDPEVLASAIEYLRKYKKVEV